MEAKAIQFAEEYGIIEYTVKGDKMIFYKTYPREGGRSSPSLTSTR